MNGFAFEVSVPQLRCFVTVASTGSIAEAARRLGLSAASVSKALTRLEDGAGVRLLHRSTHAVSLTRDGDALLGPARDAVAAAQAFEDAAAHAADGGEGGTVRITAAIGLVRHVVVPLATELARVHPAIALDVRATYDSVDLADGAIDLALRSGPLEKLPGHVQQPWFRVPWVICGAPAYLAAHGTPRGVADLDRHARIGFRNPQSGRINSWPLRRGRHEPTAHLAFDDADAVWDAMLAGVGLACAPLYVAAAALRTGRAVEVLAAHRGPATTVSLVRRDRRLAPARLTTLLAFLLARAPKLDDLHAPKVPARRRAR